MAKKNVFDNNLHFWNLKESVSNFKRDFSPNLHFFRILEHFVPYLTLTNITKMVIESKLNSHYVEWMNLSLEQFYFYLVIVLSSLTLFCILMIMGICIFPPKHTCQCRRKISDSKSNKSKRVSRAESWRFESSHYINPGTVMHSV